MYILYRYEYLFEPNLRERLVNLIGRYQALRVYEKPQHLEHRKEPAHYKVLLSEIFKKGEAESLCQLMKVFILRSNVRFDRIVGILMKERADLFAADVEFKLSREGYHIAPILASMLKKPYTLLYEAKDEETGKLYFLYEGELPENETTVIIDDVLTTGESIANAVSYLRGLNRAIKVSEAFVFVSRARPEELAVLSSLDVRVHAMIDRRDLVDRLYARRYLNRDDFRLAYLDADLRDGHGGGEQSVLRLPRRGV